LRENETEPAADADSSKKKKLSSAFQAQNEIEKSYDRDQLAKSNRISRLIIPLQSKVIDLDESFEEEEMTNQSNIGSSNNSCALNTNNSCNSNSNNGNNSIPHASVYMDVEVNVGDIEKKRSFSTGKVDSIFGDAKLSGGASEGLIDGYLRPEHILYDDVSKGMNPVPVRCVNEIDDEKFPTNIKVWLFTLD
jgi:hypothetical protein